MRWRRLAPGELDHEKIWLLVFVGAGLSAFVWLNAGWITPKCLWHEVTGFPCVGCGGTRCVRYLLRGAWAAAFLVNPLIFTTLCGIAIYNLYAATVLSLRLPRLRFDPWPAWAGWSGRIAVVTIVLGNWAWLIARGV